MLFKFEDYVLDPQQREIRRANEPIHLQPQVFDILEHLIRNRARVVSRDELIAAVWGGRIVSESALTTRINAARTAIADSGDRQRLIRTLPRKGFRFVGTVVEQEQPVEPAAAGIPGASPIPLPLARQAGHEDGLPLPRKPSIVVLPFKNMSGDPEQDFFADGIVEDLTTALSRIRWLFVIARNSSFTYKGQSVDVKQVGRDLGVRYVLEGSVRKAESRVRITAQLIDAENGAHVWAERYDRPLADLFALQDEITDAITATVEPEISAAERDRARRKPPGHLGAWGLYQRGMWHLLRRNRADFNAARKLFYKSIELDASFAVPHAALAVSWFFHITHGFADDLDTTLRQLREEAAEAVALDDRDALAHAALGIAFMENREHSKAIAEHRRALQLNPNSAFAHYASGYALMRAEKACDAVKHFDCALRLSPRDPARWSFLTLKAAALYQLHSYAEAAQLAEEAARFVVADSVWPYVHLAASLGQLHRKDEALKALEELWRRRPGLNVAAFLSWPHGRSRSAGQTNHIVDGLRKAGLREE